MRCPHDFVKTGAHRIPAHGMWHSGMSMTPTGTVQYEDFRCRLCGDERSQEVLYSYRSNAEHNGLLGGNNREAMARGERG